MATFIKEAISMSAPGEDGEYYAVGRGYQRVVDGKYKIVGDVSRITVTDDLPGLHCDMERVRVYDGDTVIFEAPLHSLEGVRYAHPAASASGYATAAPTTKCQHCHGTGSHGGAMGGPGYPLCGYCGGSGRVKEAQAAAI